MENYLFTSKLALILLLVFFGTQAIGQNDLKTIDIHTHETWLKVDQDNYNISNDGQYVFYSYGCLKSGSILNVRSVSGVINKTLPGCFNGVFSNDSAYFLYQTSGDSLGILNLRKGASYLIPNVKKFKLSFFKKQSFLIYLTPEILVIQNIHTGFKHKFPNVLDFALSENKKDVLVKDEKSIRLLDLYDFKTSIITKDADFSSFVFSKGGDKILFIKNDANMIGEESPSIYFYSKGVSRAKLLVNVGKSLLGDTLEYINGSHKFSVTGDYMYFKTKRRSLKTSESFQALEIWNYNTFSNLGSQFDIQDCKISMVSTKSVSSNKPKFISEGYVELTETSSGNYGITKKLLIHPDELYWNQEKKPEMRLLNLANGSQEDIIPNTHRLPKNIGMRFSRGGKYIYWHDLNSNDFYCYNISQKTMKNVTKNLIGPKDIRHQEDGSQAFRIDPWFPYLEWLDGDLGFLIYDKYDIWQVDPSGVNNPINLTNGYGRKNNIKFVSAMPFDPLTNLQSGSKYFLRAMDQGNKNNGFWTIQLGRFSSLKKLSMDSALYSWDIAVPPPKLKKARNMDAFLVIKQTASSSPNLYFSTDLVSFRKISYVNPEASFKWFTSELINYPISSEKNGQAILYKPKDFNPQKKYPIIINYYQKRSDELNFFHFPDLFTANVNIPWFLDRGYLVLVPDIINDNAGEITATTTISVDSAINYLSNYKWFDKTLLGVQGQSFGAFETNILISNSAYKFKAAISMSGIADLIGRSLSTAFGKQASSHFENQQFNLNCSLWECRETYIKNSPVLMADRIIAPLLVIHNRGDNGATDFSQGEAMFYALRRLKKPVWLLQYSNSGHILGPTEDKIDCTIRITQFFDHYLKGSSEPIWMTGNSKELN